MKDMIFLKFKDNIRFLEVVVNRDGEMGGLCPLFFDGAVCRFEELPKPGDKENIQKVYQYLNKLRGVTSKLFFKYRKGEESTRMLYHKFSKLSNFYTWATEAYGKFISNRKK